MELKEIVGTVIKGQQAIKFPLKAPVSGWVSDANGNHVLDIRGWGRLQYADDDKGPEIQDAIGEWVVKTLNEAAKDFY